MTILKVENLTKRFGGVVAVDSCYFGIDKGSMLGIIGPNGSGKTTLYNLITGVLKPDAGEVYYHEKRVTGWKPHKIAAEGIGRTFQLTGVFHRMTVLENMLAANFDHEEAEEFLKFVDLFKLRNELAGNLSGGQQKLLEFARMLMLCPKLIMLDEPAAGIHPNLVQKIGEHITTLSSEGVTSIIIEHNVPFVMKFCERILVLNEGKIIADGTPDEIQKDRKVIDAYLGGREF